MTLSSALTPAARALVQNCPLVTAIAVLMVEHAPILVRDAVACANEWGILGAWKPVTGGGAIIGGDADDHERGEYKDGSELHGGVLRDGGLTGFLQI